MGKIIVKRKSKFADIFRDYNVYIDGKKYISIGDGEEKELEISPGKHSIYAKIDFCKSKKISFDIDDLKVKKFELKGNFNFIKTFFIFGFAFGFSMFIAKSLFGDFDKNFLSLILYIVLATISVIILWHFAYRKNKYISIEEIN